MKSTRKLSAVCFFAIAIIPSLGISQVPLGARYIEGGNIVVAPVDGANSFQVYSKEVGEWSKVSFPKGVAAIPVIGSDVCTFKLEGEEITELVAIDSKGKAVKQELPKAATLCNPIVSGKLAFFVVDGRAYAFSAIAGRWDVIDAPANPHILNGVILVVAADWIGAFSAKTGKWKVAQTKIKTAHELTTRIVHVQCKFAGAGRKLDRTP